MTSALQHAADLAADAPPPVEIVCTVAGPRRPISTEIYAGAELRPTSLRPGAYDALALPSLFMGKIHRAGLLIVREPAAARPVVPLSKTPAVMPRPSRPAFLHRSAEPATVAPPPPARAAYVPRGDSVVGRVMALLAETQGFIKQTDVVIQFAVPRSSLNSLFKPVITSGVLVRHYIGGAACYALPDFVPPPDELVRLTDQRAAQLAQAAALLQDMEHTEQLIEELQAGKAS